MHTFYIDAIVINREGYLAEFNFDPMSLMALYRLTFKASRSEDGSIATLRIDRRFFLACLIFAISAGTSEVFVPETLDFNSGLLIGSMFSKLTQ